MKRRGASDLATILVVGLLLAAGYYFFVYQPGTSVISAELTLNYADGTSKVYVVPTLFSQDAVIDPSNQKALSSIGWSIKTTPSWTGNAKTLAVTGSTDLFIVVGSSSPVLKLSNPISYTTSTGLGTVGSGTFTVQTGSLTAPTLESWSITAGTKTLRFMVTVVAKLTMTDSALPVTTMQAESYIDFQYKVQPDGLVGLHVSIAVSPT